MGNTMQYRTLGNTGLLVSRLCLGTTTFGAGEATTGDRTIRKAVSALGLKYNPPYPAKEPKGPGQNTLYEGPTLSKLLQSICGSSANGDLPPFAIAFV